MYNKTFIAFINLINNNKLIIFICINNNKSSRDDQSKVATMHEMLFKYTCNHQKNKEKKNLIKITKTLYEYYTYIY